MGYRPVCQDATVPLDWGATRQVQPVSAIGSGQGPLREAWRQGWWWQWRYELARGGVHQWLGFACRCRSCWRWLGPPLRSLLLRQRRWSAWLRTARRATTPAPVPQPAATGAWWPSPASPRSEEHTSELQSHHDLVCRLLLEK